MSTPFFPDIDELLQRLLDDQIQPEEMKLLQEAMLKDPRVQDYYLDTIFACAVMRRCAQEAPELSESDLIRVLSGGEKRGPSQRAMRRLRPVAAALILGVLVFACLSLFRHKDPGPAIGTLAEAREAQWRGSHPHSGEPLYPGRYDLRDGAVRMDLGQGTSLLLEAPCQVELNSAGEITLRNGRLVATVAPQAAGFRVRTATALITDLGTEFGVISHSDGSAEAHVLRGRVSVALDPNRSGRLVSLVVNEHLAATVDAGGRAIRGGLAAQADLFLRRLPSVSPPANQSGRLNLADIVGGGDGHGTGIPDHGIELSTGLAMTYPAASITWRSQPNVYRPLPQLPQVDGVFVPNGGASPVIISSTRLIFQDCPRTIGTYYGGPANSSKFLDIPSLRTHTARLNGISYGTAAHPALSLHPNAGITFDLDRIRQDNPSIGIKRFSAVCGIPKDLPQGRFSPADVWVLLDGVVRFHLNCPAERSVVENVNVPIPDQVRFLTLVTTCPGLADYCWILFGDAFLETTPTVQ